MKTQSYLHSEARKVASLLVETNQRAVFAESCTGGLIAAELARIPGVSEWLCGSSVTYRNDTKARWLGISPRLLRNPGPVSEQVARKMAEGVLKRTPEADFSAAITGHLGPGAPARLDGIVFIAITSRTAGRRHQMITEIRKIRVLPQGKISNVRLTEAQGRLLREQRQQAASLAVLFMVRSVLESAKMSGRCRAP